MTLIQVLCSHQHEIDIPGKKHPICTICNHTIIHCSTCDNTIIANPGISNSGWIKYGNTKNSTTYYACPKCL